MAWLHAFREFVWPASCSQWERLLRLIWMPFWVGADLSAPRAHARFKPMSGIGPASRRLVSLLAAVRRRQMVVRFATLIARAFVLTLIIATCWAGWAAFGGPQINGDVLLAIGLGLSLAGLMYGWWHRPDLRDTARMLDRSFKLSDRVTTAIDHLTANPDRTAGHPHIAYLQIAEATNTVAILSRHASLRVRFPVRELVMITGFALLFLSLYLLRGTGSGLPDAGNAAVPAFVSAKDRLQQQQTVPNTPDSTSQDPPTVAEVQARADESAAAEQDLLTLADALDDNPLTSPIADSIRAGDYERAAAQLEAVASQVSQLSPETRGNLADELDKAADAMTGNHPGLKDATEDAADGLRSDPQQAESSLTDLSEQISETGERVESQGELASDMRDARRAEGRGASSEDTRPEPGDAQSDGEGEQQIAGDGGDAASGQSGQTAQGEQTGGSGSSGSDGQSQQEDSGSEGEASGSAGTNQGGARGQTSDSQSSGESDQENSGDAGQSGSGDVRGETGSESGESDGLSDTPDSGSGSGAGSGEGGEVQTSNGASEEPDEASAGSPDPNITDGSGSGPNGPGSEDGQPHSSITLSRAPDESGLRTGGASSSSSGSGSGAAAGAGSVSQGDVGTAGPDSNRVPEQYRRIVEDYFSDEP